MVALIIYALSVLVLNVCTIVCGLLALFLRDRSRAIALDVLLVSATLTVVAGYSAPLLPKDALVKSKKTQEAFQLNYVRQADIWATSLTLATYIDRLGQPWTGLAQLDGARSLKRDLQAAQASLKTILAAHPKDPFVAARLAIVVHESGGDAQTVYQQFEKSGGGHSSLLKALSEVYQQPAATHSPSNADEPVDSKSESFLPSRKSNWQEATLSSQLPEGWFRTAALSALYTKSDPPARQALLADNNAKFKTWRLRYTIFQGIRLVALVTGLVALVRWLKGGLGFSRSEPPHYSFRKVYGCLISNFYCQVLVAFLVGTILGYLTSPLLHHPPIDLSNLPMIFQAACVAATGIAVTLSIYFLICKPARLSLIRFFVGEQTLPLPRFLLICVSCFCILLALNASIGWLLHLIPGAPRGAGTELHSQMVDAVVSADVAKVWWYAFLICVFAPITEESLFRGLIYPWLRHRWGTAVGMIGSSTLFALSHLDAAGFFQYLACGLVFCVAYEKTRSLPVSATIHAIWNGYVLSALVWLLSPP